MRTTESRLPPDLEIGAADLDSQQDQRDILHLVNAYAQDSMGNGKPLPQDVLDRLIPGLRAHPTTMILLACTGGSAVGIAVCFRGFSTYAARPLMNVHDLAVLPEFRGRGIGRALLEAVIEESQNLHCCKVTLEVLENNHRARRLYESMGFQTVTYTEEAGEALFLARAL